MATDNSSAIENYATALVDAGRNRKKRVVAKLRYEKTREVEAKEAEKNALVDSLTGLYNRRYFNLQLAAEMEKATPYFQRRETKPLSLIIFDLDYFKEINDRYGHGSGDEAMKTMANIVQGPHHVLTSELVLGKKTDKKQVLRETDVVCRYGGDEFTVILPDTTLQKAVQVAERIRFNIEAQSIRKGQKISLTGSLGVAEFIPGEDRDSFFDRADQALYQAKKNGRNQVTAATP